MILSNGKRTWVDFESSPVSEIVDKSSLPIIHSFFKRIRIKGVAAALEQLLASNPDMDAGSTEALHLKKQIVSIHETSGRFMEFRLLKKGFLDDDIGVYSYLAKYEKRFYRFVFTFYNNGDAIRLYKFLFDDDLDTELEKSLRESTP